MRAKDAPIAVAAPLPEEIAPFLRRLHQRRRVEIAGRTWTEGSLRGVAVVAGSTGDGARSAAAAVRALLSERAVSGLIVIGVAGALADDLSIGDVVVPGRIVWEGERFGDPDPALLNHVPRDPPVRRGNLVSAPALVASPAAKAALRKQHDDEPIAVDLESAAMAAAASEAGVPYLVLRAISDTAGESLPDFLVACQEADGRIRRGALIRSSLLRPSRLRTLIGLARRMRRLALRLADVAEHVIVARDGARV